MNDSNDGTSPANDTGTNSPYWIPRAVDKIKNKFQEHRAQKKESAPDRAARRTANATWVIALFTIVAVEVGIAQWTALSNTDGKIGEQTKAIKRQLDLMEADQRPWIKVETEAFDAIQFFNVNGMTVGHISVKYFATNVGKSPAFGVEIQPKAFLLADGHTDLDGDQKRWCDIVKKNRFPHQSLFLFPGEKRPWEFQGATIGTGPSPQDLEKYSQIEAGKRTISLWLHGCATYDFGRSGTVRQTGFVYHVARLIKRAGIPDAMSYNISLDESVPKDQVLLFPSASADGITN